MEKKRFYRELLAIGIPAALQNLVFSTINISDVLMIGKLGESKLAALGLANQVFFLMILILYGVNSGAAVFMSQFFGKKDTKSLHKVLKIALISSFITSSVFLILGHIYPRELLGFYTKDPEVLNYGVKYLSLVSFSYVLAGFGMVYNVQLRSIGIAKVGVISSVTALCFNIFLNYSLIFGNFGFPKLGIEGAAIATIISRFVEVSVSITIIYWKRYPLACNLFKVEKISLAFIKRFTSTTIPVIGNEVLWALGIMGYMMVYARMGTASVAAFNMVDSIANMTLATVTGVATAAAVMVGKSIGAGRIDKAIMDGIKLGKISFFYGIILGIILVIANPFIVGFYNLNPEMNHLVKMTIYVLAIMVPIRAYNTTMVIGILRSGGDVKYCLVLDIGALWFVGLPMVIYGGLYLALPIYIVYGLAASEEVIKFVFGVRRVLSRTWAKNLVKDI